MNEQPEIAEPKSDALVLLSCLVLSDELTHDKAIEVLEKYSNPLRLSAQIIRTSRESVSDTVKLLKIQQILTGQVYASGSDDEALALFVETSSEDETKYAA